MKFLWLQDNDRKGNPSGGAEQADYHRVETGRKLGLDITYLTRQTFTIDKLNDFDFICLSNNTSFTFAERDAIFRKPYLCDSHDHNCWGTIAQRHPNIFNDSVLNFWKSPDHQQLLQMFATENNNICLPPRIPTNFTNLNLERRNDTMCCTFLHYLKGIPNVVQWARDHPDRHVDFYFGRSIPDMLRLIQQTPNCTAKGYVDRDDLPAIYNTYNHYIHLPNTLEPSGTALGEAHICGCNLIINDLVGFASYEWFRDRETFKTHCNNADRDFWSIVFKTLGI